MTVVLPSLCARRCKLTLPSVAEAGTYAVLFSGSGDPQGARLPAEMFSGGANAAQSDGGDVCFATSSDGSTGRRSMEIVGTIGTSTCEIWVDVPLSESETTDIYVFYKSSSGTLTQPEASASYGSQAVWTAVGDLAAVWHFGDGSTLSKSDSTGQLSDATEQGTGTAAASGQVGGAVSFNGSGYLLVTDGLTPISGDNTHTVSVWVKVASGISSGPVLWSRSTAGSYYLQLASNTAYMQVSSTYRTYSPTVGNGEWHRYDMVKTGADDSGNLFFDGDILSTYTGEIGSTPTMDEALRIGTFYTGSKYQLIGLEDEFRISTVARSEDYIATDYAIGSATSWLTFGTAEDNSTAAPSVDAATASFALTGNAVTLTAQRKLSVSAAAFTETGNAVTLTAQRKIAPTVGEFTLTGQATGLTAQRKLAPAAASFTLTGNAAALQAARKLALSTGAFTLTGNAVTLSLITEYQLQCDVAAFVATFNAASLLARRKIDPAAGEFVLTGIAAALTGPEVNEPSTTMGTYTRRTAGQATYRRT